MPKLHLGAGHNVLEGWLNTDWSPHHDEIVFLDVTFPFPFPDSSFAYVFSEHLIEHISHSEGRAMVAECSRVLRPGGTLRIATPSLDNLISLFDQNKSEASTRYVEWAMTTNHFPPGSSPECFILNHFMRGWGHQFVYDPETLRAVLEECGFSGISSLAPGQSNDVQLQGIEGHGRVIGEEQNRFETMVLEARRG